MMPLDTNKFFGKEDMKAYLDKHSQLECCANCIHPFRIDMGEYTTYVCSNIYGYLNKQKEPVLSDEVCQNWEWNQARFEEREIK